MIRELRQSDIKELERIHKEYYEQEFTFPNFLEHFICAYVVEKNGTIITAGGIRTIVECIAITNKNISVKERREGLTYILNASKYFTERSNYNQLHCFVQDENWMKHLINAGFEHTKGKSLVMEL